MRCLCALSIAVVFAWSVVPAAHEIPNEVTVQTFLKPEGQRLVLLVRAPLKAMRDMRVPEREGGFVDLDSVDDVLRASVVTWLVPWITLYEGETQLGTPELIGVRASLPADRSFDSYDRALAHITNSPRLASDTELYWQDGLIDVALVYPIRSDRSEFSIASGLTRLGMRVNVVMRFLPPGGAERAFDLHGDPGMVRLDPRWHQAAFRFVQDGFLHILDGIDHLLFLACLVIPFRQVRPLVVIVTAFTVAHSITLIASAFDMAPGALWFPPLIETLIAMSIVYMGLENIVGSVMGGGRPAVWDGGRLEGRRSAGGDGGRLEGRRSAGGTEVARRDGGLAWLRRRWLITFGFGLVHGFGFSFALRENLQFAGNHLLTSLLAFNVGVELGQLLVLALFLPALALGFRYVIAPVLGTIIMSALVVHTAWHWMIDRGAQLPQYQYQLPVFDLALAAALVRWLILVVIIAAAIWAMSGMIRPPAQDEAPGGAS